MSKEKLMGVSLEKLEGPIIEALTRYQETADGLVIDAPSASKLELTPDKPNSARTSTSVSFKGQEVGTLYTIAFKPGDGTGSELDHKLSDLTVAQPYPRAALVVPRAKTGVREEAHLTIATHEVDNAHAEPSVFDGEFDLLGLKDGQVVKIGSLGRAEVEALRPKTTLTVGRHEGKRFGDPHAVYSGKEGLIQVCAFLAISDDVHAKHPDILKSLMPQLPMAVNK